MDNFKIFLKGPHGPSSFVRGGGHLTPPLPPRGPLASPSPGPMVGCGGPAGLVDDGWRGLTEFSTFNNLSESPLDLWNLGQSAIYFRSQNGSLSYANLDFSTFETVDWLIWNLVAPSSALLFIYFLGEVNRGIISVGMDNLRKQWVSGSISQGASPIHWPHSEDDLIQQTLVFYQWK